MDLDVDNGANVAPVATEGTSELGPPSKGQICYYSLDVWTLFFSLLDKVDFCVNIEECFLF